LGDRWREAKVLLIFEGVIRNLHGLGDAKQHQQQTKEAQSMVLESLATFRELGDQASVAAGLLALGITFLTLGQPKEAQPALEECIVLCQELGSHSDTFIEAIGYLGVVHEFLGLYDQMWTQGQSLLVLAQETVYWRGLRLAYYLTGAAALAEQAYQEAELWLQKNVALNRVKQAAAQLAFGLTGWALSTYWLGDTMKASQQLVEALQIASGIGAIRPAAHGLLLVALLLTDRGERERAVELHALTTSYPFVANSRWCHAVAGWRLEAVAATLPTDVVTAAQKRGHERDIWVTVEELLTELAGDEALDATGH
jgi:tetratricopeptide (TPR) repeat protein